VRRLQPARSAISCGCLPSSHQARMRSRTLSEMRGAIQEMSHNVLLITICTFIKALRPPQAEVSGNGLSVTSWMLFKQDQIYFQKIVVQSIMQMTVMNSEVIHESEQVAWEHLPGEAKHVDLGVRWFTSHGMGGSLSRKLRRGGSAESGCHWMVFISLEVQLLGILSILDMSRLTVP